MKYAFILSEKGNYSNANMFDWLSVSSSGYYDWLDREPSQQAKRRERLKAKINEIFHEFKQRYGSPKITVELNARGFSCCENLVAEIMAECGLKAKKGKAYSYYPAIYANTNVSGNLLNVSLPQRNQTKNGWLISPISKWIRASFTWLQFWIFSLVKSLAGH